MGCGKACLLVLDCRNLSQMLGHSRISGETRSVVFVSRDWVQAMMRKEEVKVKWVQVICARAIKMAGPGKV
jgi:hypothetical protein